MKVSIITVIFNGVNTIEDCIKSISSQTYSDIEHIIIDGGSTDGSIDLIKKYKANVAKIISEPDNGLYDAMNKGIKIATGDIIGICNSDDVYANNKVVETIVKNFTDFNTDSCYSDLVYIDRHNHDDLVRYWKAGNFSRNRFLWGWMPPHPTFFVKKSIYDKFGLLNTGFPLAADYELMIRFLYKYNISTVYIPEVLVKMSTGGMSNSWSYRVKAIIENYRAWKVNNLRINPLTFVFKPVSKIFQFLSK